MLLGILATSMLGNALTGWGLIKAAEGVIRGSQNL